MGRKTKKLRLKSTASTIPNSSLGRNTTGTTSDINDSVTTGSTVVSDHLSSLSHTLASQVSSVKSKSSSNASSDPDATDSMVYASQRKQSLFSPSGDKIETRIDIPESDEDVNQSS